MNTRPSWIAAEDLTGPPVLKFQSRANFAGKLPLVTPSSAGPPLNIGQPLGAPASPPAWAKAPDAQRAVAIKNRSAKRGPRRLSGQLCANQILAIHRVWSRFINESLNCNRLNLRSGAGA